MRYDPRKHHRRSIRLKGYDYAWEGAYFVTISTQGRLPFFEDDTIRATAESCWVDLPHHFPMVELNKWVVMSNHVHGIIFIVGRGVQLNASKYAHTDAPTRLRNRDTSNLFSVMSPRRKTLAVVVRTYKAAVTTECRRAGYTQFGWQRNYFERIVRTEEELHRTRQYILDNPLQRELDENNQIRI